MNRRIILQLLLAGLLVLIGSFTNAGPTLLFAMARGIGNLIDGAPVPTVNMISPSPDGTRTAAVLRMAYGGATVNFTYHVVISPGLTSTGFEPEQWSWRAEGLAPTSLRWIGEDVVEIRIEGDRWGHLATIERRPEFGVLVIESLDDDGGT
jgi:hypothetical protein